MYFYGLKILIFILVHETIADKYYYKDKNGLYDVYYGPNSIRGYKEFKSPKSYKIQFDDRGDRPGKCSPGVFQCKEPFHVKDTNVFECEVDYQCPSYYRCCQVSCFQHKICQPASTEDDEENEIPAVDPTVVTKKDVSTKLSTILSTHPATKSTSPLVVSSIDDFTTEESIDIPEPQSQLRSTVGTVETLTTNNASIATGKSVSRFTETPSTLPESKTPHFTITTSRSTFKPHKTTSKTSHATSNIYSTPSKLTPSPTSKKTNNTTKPHKTTLETSQTTSNIYSTPPTSSTLPTTKKAPTTTITRRSTSEPHTTTLKTSQTTSNIYSTPSKSTILPTTKKPPITTTALRSTSEPYNTTLKTSQSTSNINSTPAKLSVSTTKGNIDEDITDDEDLTFSGDSSTPDEDADWSIFGTKTTKVPITSLEPESKPATSEITTPGSFLKDLHSATKLSTFHSSTETNFTTKRPSESQTISTPEFRLNTTDLFITTTKAKLSSPKLNTQKSTTRITDITSDDEDLTFSGDGDEAGIDKHTESQESYTESNYPSSLATSFTSSVKAAETGPEKNGSNNVIKTTQTSPPASESTNKSPILTTSSSEFFTSTVNALETSIADKNGTKDNMKSTKTMSSDLTTETALNTLSTVSESTTIMFSSTVTSSTKSFRSTEKAEDTFTGSYNDSTQTVNPKSSIGTTADLPTSLGIASSIRTTTANVNKDTISDDEDLSFSGDGAEGTNIAGYTLGNVITNITSLKPEEETTNVPTTSISQPSSKYITTEENINTENDDDVDDDLIFSGDHQIKTTTGAFEKSNSPQPPESLKMSTVSQTVTSPENSQKNTNDEDFSFNDNYNQSTKMDKAETEKPVDNKTEFITEISTESVSALDKSNVSYTIKNRQSSTKTVSTKSTSLPTYLTTKEQTRVTSSKEFFTTYTADIDIKENKSSESDTSSHTYSLSSTTKIPSTKLTTETGKEIIAENATINTNENVGNIPGSEFIFANSLLGLLRKVPAVLIGTKSTVDTDPYFNSFLQFLGRFSNLVKQTDLDIDLINDNSKSSAQRETVAPS